MLCTDISSLSNAGIPVWAPKLGTQTKVELTQKKHQPFNHIFNTNASTHSQAFNLRKTL